MTITTPERHPVCGLVDALAAALLDDEAPSRRYTTRIYHVEDENLVPAESLPPFYGIVVLGSEVTDEQVDRIARRYEVRIVAYQQLAAPEPGGRQTGLVPRDTPARAGVLDLLWAAHQVVRGRGFGSWGYVRSLGETATQAITAPDGAVTGLVRRSLRLQYAHADTFTVQG